MRLNGERTGFKPGLSLFVNSYYISDHYFDTFKDLSVISRETLMIGFTELPELKELMVADQREQNQ